MDYYASSKSLDWTVTTPHVKDRVRIIGYGGGATLEDCGKEGYVTALRRTRVEVSLDSGHVRYVRPYVLRLVERIA